MIVYMFSCSFFLWVLFFFQSVTCDISGLVWDIYMLIWITNDNCDKSQWFPPLMEFILGVLVGQMNSCV